MSAAPDPDSAPPPGPTAVVTGASRGHGRVVARLLAARGWRVVAGGRDAEALAAAARDLRAAGNGAAEVVEAAGDATDPAARAALARAAGPRVDLLVLNASTLGPSPRPRLEALEPAALRAALETNVVAQHALTLALLPALRAARGRVAAVTSDAARGGWEGWGAYGATKAALELWARTLAAEEPDLAVTLVDPGDLRTRMHAEAFPGEDLSDRPEPEVVVPFWTWLLGRAPEEVDGRRLEAQAERWDADAPEGAVA